MNFLAHLWLAERSGTSLAGSILGDVVHGPDLSAYPADVALGIRLHRRVDVHTDRHPQVQALREEFAPGARRYAGIILDLVFDHVLAHDWDDYSPQPLATFCAHAGSAIAQASPWFEHAGARRSTAADFATLLQSYAGVDGIERAIARTAGRLRQPQRLLDAASNWSGRLPALRRVLPELLHDLEPIMRQSYVV